MNQEATRKDWNERGFSIGIFRDPPGQVWADYVHWTDELVMLAEGEIELEVECKTQRPLIGLGRLIMLIQFPTPEDCIRTTCLSPPKCAPTDMATPSSSVVKGIE